MPSQPGSLGAHEPWPNSPMYTGAHDIYDPMPNLRPYMSWASVYMGMVGCASWAPSEQTGIPLRHSNKCIGARLNLENL